MPRFRINRPRKVRHCLIFDRKTANATPVTPSERIAMFQRERAGPSQSTGEQSIAEHTNNQDKRLQNGAQSEEKNVNIKGEAYGAIQQALHPSTQSPRKRKKSPEELAIRKRSIEQNLKHRRNAVCNEIERGWFLQGAYLEKHRHNLQVTHELTNRGLLWP